MAAYEIDICRHNINYRAVKTSIVKNGLIYSSDGILPDLSPQVGLSFVPWSMILFIYQTTITVAKNLQSQLIMTRLINLLYIIDTAPTF